MPSCRKEEAGWNLFFLLLSLLPSKTERESTIRTEVVHFPSLSVTSYSVHDVVIMPMPNFRIGERDIPAPFSIG